MHRKKTEGNIVSIGSFVFNCMWLVCRRPRFDPNPGWTAFLTRSITYNNHIFRHIPSRAWSWRHSCPGHSCSTGGRADTAAAGWCAPARWCSRSAATNTKHTQAYWTGQHTVITTQHSSTHTNGWHFTMAGLQSIIISVNIRLSSTEFYKNSKNKHVLCHGLIKNIFIG